LSYSAEVLADSPVDYFRCGEASADLFSQTSARFADNASGNAVYQQGSALPSDPTDFSFRCTSAVYFSVTYDAAYDVGDVATLECWLKRGDTATSEIIILSRDQGMYLGLNNNLLFLAKTNVVGIVSSTISITDTTTWHHCVHTKNGSTVNQYIDGVDVTGTVTNATWQNGTTPDFRIASDGGSNQFIGYLDEIAVYNTALSATRVKAHYLAALTARQVPSEFPPRHFGPF